MNNCEYVREYYGVPACIGRSVIVYGKSGVIVEDRGHYIGVNLDEDKPNVIGNYHPTDNVIYGEIREIRKIKKMTRSQQRYRDYIHSECSGSFAEYLGIYK